MGIWKQIEVGNRKKLAIAICSFKHTDSHTLSFKIGEQLVLERECKDWYYGYLISTPAVHGIFPKNHVYLFDRSELVHTDHSVNEIDALLKEWINIWHLKYEECEAHKMELMGYFKNLYNVRNIIIANRASIDEIKDHKKSAIDKILQCNNLLGLDVIAYDNSYNLLDPLKSSTIYLFNELKKNSLVKANILNKSIFQSSLANINDDIYSQFNDINPTFSHQLSTSVLTAIQQQNGNFSSVRAHSVASRSSISHNNYRSTQSAFYIKVSIENLRPSENVTIDENVQFYVNLFVNKENFYLSENAILDLAQMRFDFVTLHQTASSSSNLKMSQSNQASKNTVIFSDLNEKDLRSEKADSKLYLIVYAVKNLKGNQSDGNLPISRLIAGGVYDLGTTLGSLINLSTDKRNISPSMNLFLNDCELPAIINPKILDTKVNLKDQHDHQTAKQSKNPLKDVYCTLSFKCDLAEATYNEIIDKYTYLKDSISRKMTFPDIIMPDDYRNDFYVFVYDGELNKAKNYELIANLVQFVTESDRLVEKQISLEDDDDEISESQQQSNKAKRQYFLYKSLVYVKQDKPKWHEIVKISIGNGKKVEKIKNTYLRFIIRTHDSVSSASSSSSLQSSASSSSNKNDKIKIYGRCYLKLTNDDGSAIKDEPTMYLPINKIDQDDIEANEANFVRFKVPSTASLNQSVTTPTQLQQASFKEYLRLKINVVSTQLTQNSTLLKLLSFPSDKNPNHSNYKFLQQYLDELLNVKDEQSAEIVKFLQPLFEKLIDILLDLNTKHPQSIITPDLIQKHENDIRPLVFKILIAIFQIIDNQNKFASFRNVIDAYLNKHFSITLAHKPLFQLFLQNIGDIYKYFLNYKTNSNKIINNGNFNVNLNDKDDYIINIIKSMEYIFKFSFKSRELLSMYKNKNNPHSDKIDQFETDVKAIFTLLTQIITLKNTHQQQHSQHQQSHDSCIDLDVSINGSQLQQNSNSSAITNIDTYLMKIQSYILKNVINLLPILIDSKRFTYKTIAEFYIGFLCSKFCLNTKFLSKLVNSKLFEIQESRHLIIEPLCKTLLNMIMLETNEERHVIDARLESIGRLFTELMNVLERKDIGYMSQDVNEICKCLPQLIRVSIYLKNQSTCRQIYATVIISILRIMEIKHFQLYFNLSINQNDATTSTSNSNTLQLLLYISTCLISDDIYPKDWSDLLVLRNSVILNALHNIADRISNNHLKDFNATNKKIWQDYFDASVSLITDMCLQLEKFSDNKRKNILHKYDDMRVKAALDLKNMWYSLGDNKQHFIPNMIDSFMRVAVIPIKQINEEIIPIFYDMISSELYVKYQTGGQAAHSFDSLIVPNKLVTILDEHIENGAGNYEFRDAFQKIFTDKFLKNRMLSDNIDYVHKLVDLIDLLIEYRNLQVNDSLNQLKSLYLYELMNFYKTMNRNDLYLKYIDYLRKIHVNSKNNVCAAHTLILHAALLNWSNDVIDTNFLRYSSYPNIKYQKDLKERLYIDIIAYFTEGKAWENAFEFSKFLRQRYEEQYEYEKLCGILGKEAELCKNILYGERYFSNYYLVGFYGKEFSKLLQNRQFVFMSGALEDIGSFRPRIQSWFPNASLLAHSNAPSETELNSHAQYIQITKLEPIYEAKSEFENLNISQKILKYYQLNEVNKFKHSYRKETKLNEADPTLWWIRERTVQITNSLPHIINFYPVKSEVLIDISPIQNACNSVRKQYGNLKMYLSEILDNHAVAETHVRVIQGTVDAGVNGGLPKYEIFLKDAYLNENPESASLIGELRDLIIETIDLAETYLLWCIKFMKKNPLLEILESEQLPKLKAKFQLPTHTNVNKKALIDDQFGQKHNGLDTSSTTTTTSTPIRKLSANDLQIKSKHMFSSSASKQSSASLSTNHRDSVSSLPSINSDDESSKNSKLIVLNEQLNPIRPLRPKTGLNNSNNSSRPISHISDDGTSQLSLLPEHHSASFNDASYDTINNGSDYTPATATAPPKPALPHKPLNIKLKLKQQANFFGLNLGGSGGSSSSYGDNKSERTNSSGSLNDVQYRNA